MTPLLAHDLIKKYFACTHTEDRHDSMFCEGQMAYTESQRFTETRGVRHYESEERPSSSSQKMAYSEGTRNDELEYGRQSDSHGGRKKASPHSKGIHAQRQHDRQGQEQSRRGGWWATEPNVGRVANGVPMRVDRLTGLGNAVVPAQAREAFERLMGLK